MASDIPAESAAATSKVAASEKVQHHDARRVASALDVLVRTARSDRVNAERLAPRNAEVVRSLRGALVLSPRAISFEGTVIVQATGNEAAWCLPAYMAGLRSISARPNLSADELLEFALRLGALRVDTAQLEAFRDYLWSGGSEGLITELAPSFVEVATTLEVISKTSEAVGAVRAFAVFSEDGVQIKAPELDIAATEAEFDVPVDPLRRAWSARTIEPSGADLSMARGALKDPRALAKAELKLPIDVTETRPSVPAKRAARRLKTWVDGPLGAPQLEMLLDLFKSADPYVMAVVAAASGRELGATLGSRLTLDEGPLRELAQRLISLELETATKEGLVSEVLRRACTEAAPRELLERWARDGKTLEIVRAAAAIPEGTEGLVASWNLVSELLQTSGGDEASVHAWIKGAPSAAIAARAAGLGVFQRMEGKAAAIFTELDPPRRNALAIAALGSEAGVNAVAAAAVASHAEIFSGKVIFQVFSALLRTPNGRAALVAITSDRKASDDTRIAALEVAATRDDIGPEVFATRMGHLLDSDRVRNCRATLKREYKERKKGSK